MGITAAPHNPMDNGSAANVAETGGHGGMFATILSALALAFSGLSFYESALKTADLEVYVPPVIHYARDSGGDVELFAIPITIVNDGARTGTVLSVELEAENMRDGADPKIKRYYSAYMGEHPVQNDAPSRAFAPLSIAGHATFSDTVRFYPVGNPLPKLVDDAGEYRFTLKLNTALPSRPDLIDRTFRKDAEPVPFQMTLPWISEQQLGFRRATIAMHAKDWKPTRASSPAQ